MKRLTKILCSLAALGAVSFSLLPLTGCSSSSDELVLRVSNWEEYIDLGGWDDDGLIEIENPYDEEAEGIIGVNSMVEDFTEWFNSLDYGFTVKVEYSTFGTNEDLYNRLNLGDTYDLVCPSDYLMMQLIKEGKAEPYSEDFHNTEIETNYYARNVSPYIDEVFKSNTAEIKETGEVVTWDKYAAGYMWGTSGIVYNPELIDVEDVTSWEILRNDKYSRKITIKDNVRDSYFAALGIHNAEELLSEDITNERRNALMNATDDETIAAAEDILKQIKNNVYSFETDSGKADMITGKIAANFQWSGDAVFIMDEAEGDENNPVELWYSIPDECTNLWFDGWVMLKDGIKGNEKRKIAAEAFVNFLSRPDNAIRNMDYIGYTSSIAGDPVLDYLKWNYEADESCENVYEYDLSYFFGGDEAVIIETDGDQFEISDEGTIARGRQLFAQYAPQEVTLRSVVMMDFGDKLADINQMWINVRCLDVKDFRPAVVWSVVGIIVAGTAIIVLYKFRYKIFYRREELTA